ncbi:siderophore ABC transporter substrate-binding protein [Psychrobacter raelei]|jgi:iron complex transport system substrate-binding protein|uniref:siderophore ABC transporter substrate-binding protein n=1 Tax=Psychrobacter raelei TaxID=2565531 RepID=UPI003F604B57
MFTKRLSSAAASSAYPKAKLALLTLMVSGALFGCSPKQTDTQTDSAAETQSETGSEAATTESSATDNQAQVSIDTTRGEVTLPTNPEPLAVYDMTLMQDLAALEVPVAGLPDNLHLDNLKAAGAPESQNIGTLFEPDMEALNQMQPKAILIGSRMAEKYDALSKMAPTLDLTLDTENIYESSKQRLADLGKLFNKADKAAQLQQDIDQAIEQAKAASAGKGNGLVVLVNGNKISAYGEKSRFGFLHTVFGIPAADTQIEDGRHGQPVSFEYLQKIDPDWLFVLDRSSAVGEEGVGADAVLDNPLMHQTKAWKNKHIVYLSPDSYLAFGGYYQWLKDTKIVTDALSKAETVESAQ